MMLPRVELLPILALFREIDALMLGPCSPHDLLSFATRREPDISTAYYRTVSQRLPREVRAAIESYDIDAEVDAGAPAFRHTEVVRLFYFLEAAVQFFHQPMHFSDAVAVRAFRDRCRVEMNSLLPDLEAIMSRSAP